LQMAAKVDLYWFLWYCSFRYGDVIFAVLHCVGVTRLYDNMNMRRHFLGFKRKQFVITTCCKKRWIGSL